MTDKYRRRDILKQGITVSALSQLGFAGTISASATGNSDDVDALLESEEVEAIKQAAPRLEIQTDEAILIATRGESQRKSVLRDRSGIPAGVAIPTNHGTLTVVTLDGDKTAILDLDEQIPDIKARWPEGVTARLISSGDVATFQRSTTEAEANEILEGIGRHDLVQSTSVEVSIAPEENEFYVLHIDTAAKEIERIRGQTPSIRTSTNSNGIHGGIEKDHDGFQVQEHETHSVGDSMGSFTSSCDCDKAMADVIFCVYQAAGCLSCFVGSPVPPVLIACLILVCAGGTGGIFLSLLGDLGCLPPSNEITEGCVTDCIDVWV